jgi:hypothetical protein
MYVLRRHPTATGLSLPLHLRDLCKGFVTTSATQGDITGIFGHLPT